MEKHEKEVLNSFQTFHTTCRGCMEEKHEKNIRKKAQNKENLNVYPAGAGSLGGKVVVYLL